MEIRPASGSLPTPPPDDRFTEITQLILQARQRAVQAVNIQLIELYWQVGAHISRKLSQAEWGEGVVAELAAYLARTQPGLRGFTRSNLFRMGKFYDAYQGDTKVAPLAPLLSWSHHLLLLERCKPLAVAGAHCRVSVPPAKPPSKRARAPR